MATAVPVYEESRVSIGRVFRRALNAIGANPIVIIGLSVVVGAIPLLALNYLVAKLGITPSPASFSFGKFMAFLLVSIVITMVVSSFVQAAMTRATVSASEGRQATFAECLTTALQVFVPLFAMAILAGIAMTFGMMLLIVPGIILFLAWSVASPTLVIERTGIIGALRRSSELTKGAKWKILGIFLMIMVAYWLLALLVGAVGLAAYNPVQSTAGLSVGSFVGSIILGAALNAASGTVWPSLYVELREWKDGFSVENLADVFA